MSWEFPGGRSGQPSSLKTFWQRSKWTKFMQNFVHFERCQNVFNEDGCPDRPPGNSQLILRHQENIIPEPCFRMALKLREINIRTRSAFQQLSRIVIKEDPEIEDRGGDGMPIHKNVLLDHMPAARPNHHRWGLLTQPVLFSFDTDELDATVDRITKVNLPLDHVLPCRRVGILKISHVHVRA